MHGFNTGIHDIKSLCKIYCQKAQRSYQKDIARVREGAKDSTISEGEGSIYSKKWQQFFTFFALFDCLRLNCFHDYRLGIRQLFRLLLQSE